MHGVMAPVGMPRRVLMTVDAVGGVWSYALELARGLTGAGHEVLLAASGPAPTDAQAAAANDAGATLVHSNHALEWMPGAERDLDDAAIWLLEVAQHFRPDVVHLNGFAHAVLPWKVPNVVVAHSCVCSWWRAVKGDAIPDEWNGYYHRTLAGLRAADLVVAPTGAFLGQLEAIYGPLPRTRLIWNGRDLTPLRGVDKKPLFFSAGRVWDEAKNLRALARVADRLPWPVSIAGACLPESGTATIQPSSVEWLGELSPAAMQQWYGQASVFVLPARYEPFGLAALEAALSGCALVLGDIPTLRELWNGAALFVSPDDDDALAAALDRVADDRELRRRLAGRAHRRAQQYSAGRMVGGYLEAYAALFETRHAVALAG